MMRAVPMLSGALAGCASVLLLCLPVNASSAAALPHKADFIREAIADVHRPAEDRESDALRKPAESLALAGVRPGQTILELIPGSGYYTRLLSAAVGPRGRVYALAPPRSTRAAVDAPDPAAPLRSIAGDPHYHNVTVLAQAAWTVVLPRAADLAWTSLNYHDFHNVTGLDVQSLNEAVWRNLRPGGTYLVIDHAAAAGTGLRDTATLHRIDPESVLAEVLSAGFELQARGHALANPADTHELAVFDPVVRGRTDRFILVFRRPLGVSPRE